MSSYNVRELKQLVSPHNDYHSWFNKKAKLLQVGQLNNNKIRIPNEWFQLIQGGMRSKCALSQQDVLYCLSALNIRPRSKQKQIKFDQDFLRLLTKLLAKK